MTNALKQALLTIAAATIAVACIAHPGATMDIPSQRASVAVLATTLTRTCGPGTAGALAKTARAGEENRASRGTMASCSDAAVKEAGNQIVAECGIANPGWALLLCDKDGDLEKTRIRCDDDPPDFLLAVAR